MKIIGNIIIMTSFVCLIFISSIQADIYNDIKVECWGQDLSDNKIGGWKSSYPHCTLDDGGGDSNAIYDGKIFIDNDRICITLENLKTEAPPHHTLSVGFKISLLNGNFIDGSNTIIIEMVQFSRTPNNSPVTKCLDLENNTCLNAFPLELNQIVNAKIDYPGQNGEDGDCDYYKIEIPEKTNISIYTTGDTDTYGILFDCCNGTPSDCPIIQDDDSGEFENFRFDIALDTETYYLKVRHADKISGTGNYTLYVQNINTPPTTPIILTPKNNTQIPFSESILFEWQPSKDLDGDSLRIKYLLQVSDLNDNCVYTNETNLTSLNSIIFSGENNPFELNTNYKLTIKAVDSNNAWSKESSSQFIFIVPVKSEKEKIVLIDGISLDKTARCSSQECPNRESYLYKYLSETFLDEILQNGTFGKLFKFEWSGDMVAHGEHLKTKFSEWFYSEVCQEGETCYVSFLAHSWGSVIMSDFVASMSEDTSIKVRTIVTFGSPVTGAQIAFYKDSFWEIAIKKLTNNENYIACKKGKWINVVHPNDPVAWDILGNGWIWDYKIPGVENYTHEGLYSNKGRLKETFPVNNSEFDLRYIGTTLLFNVTAERALEIIVKNWTSESSINLDAHFNGYINEINNKKRLVKYITDRLPSNIEDYECNWSTPAIIIIDNEIYPETTGGGLTNEIMYYNNFKYGSYSNQRKRFNQLPSVTEKINFLSRPSAFANRAECLLLSMLVNGDNVENNLPSSYTDVTESHPLYDIIETATKKGIVQGYIDSNDQPIGLFKPDEPITRIEAIKIILNTFQLDLLENSNVGPRGRKWSESLFIDINPSDWWYKYVKASYLYEILEGYGNEKFGPNDKITRSQIVKAVFQTLQLSKKNYYTIGHYLEPELEVYNQDNKEPIGSLSIQKQIDGLLRFKANFIDPDGDRLSYYWIVNKGKLIEHSYNEYIVFWVPNTQNNKVNYEFINLKLLVQDGKGALGYIDKSLKINNSFLELAIIALHSLIGNKLPYNFEIDLDYDSDGMLSLKDAVILLKYSSDLNN